MRKSPALLAAGGVAALLAFQTPASAIPPPVTVATGSCPADYIEAARVGATAVCVYPYSPGVRITTTGCDAGETPVLVGGQYGACLS